MIPARYPFHFDYFPLLEYQLFRLFVFQFGLIILNRDLKEIEVFARRTAVAGGFKRSPSSLPFFSLSPTFLLRIYQRPPPRRFTVTRDVLCT